LDPFLEAFLEDFLDPFLEDFLDPFLEAFLEDFLDPFLEAFLEDFLDPFLDAFLDDFLDPFLPLDFLLGFSSEPGKDLGLCRSLLNCLRLARYFSANSRSLCFLNSLKNILLILNS